MSQRDEPCRGNKIYLDFGIDIGGNFIAFT